MVLKMTVLHGADKMTLPVFTMYRFDGGTSLAVIICPSIVVISTVNVHLSTLIRTLQLLRGTMNPRFH
jgi:hypothetical protein